MKLHLLCKRHYTGKDLIRNRFGRLYHLPVQLHRLGMGVSVTAIDYRYSNAERHALDGVVFRTLPATPMRLLRSLAGLPSSLRTAAPDILLASGDSHIGYLGLRLARGLGIPFVLDVYDYYPALLGNRIPGMKRFFRRAVERADLVLCASTPLMERLAALNAAQLLVENGVDRRLFAPMDQTESRSRLGIEPDSPVIGYFGSIQPARGPLLIDACRQVRAKRPNLTLLLAGTVSRVSINEPWIRYLGEVEQAGVPALIAACNLVAIPYTNDAFNAMCGPCKIAEYLSCGKPVVATNIAGHREIFQSAPQSLCRPDPADMAEAICRQLDQPQVAPFPAHLEWEAIARALLDAFSDLPRARSTA
jgi:glycosyltransferase involved in cell wall biosynthesis